MVKLKRFLVIPAGNFKLFKKVYIVFVNCALLLLVLEILSWVMFDLTGQSNSMVISLEK